MGKETIPDAETRARRMLRDLVRDVYFLGRIHGRGSPPSARSGRLRTRVSVYETWLSHTLEERERRAFARLRERVLSSLADQRTTESDACRILRAELEARLEELQS
jgi:hypothetical protein